MDTFGIIGWPVAHSLSPAMHNAAFRALGLRAVYGLLPVAPEALPRAVEGLRALGIKGVSVTIPHKEAVIPLLDEVDDVAREIGAVNTILLREGRLLGTNTDWIGVREALLEATALSGLRAVVVGAGGAARAVVYALRREGAEVTIYNRTPSRAEALAREMGASWRPWEDLSRAEGDLLVQTTSVGLEEDRSPVPTETVRRFRVVMDLVYRPLRTRLLREAEEAGLRVVDGLRMLVHQGAAQFRLFVGAEPPVEVMERAAREALEGGDDGG